MIPELIYFYWKLSLKLIKALNQTHFQQFDLADINCMRIYEWNIEFEQQVVYSFPGIVLGNQHDGKYVNLQYPTRRTKFTFYISTSYSRIFNKELCTRADLPSELTWRACINLDWKSGISVDRAALRCSYWNGTGLLSLLSIGILFVEYQSKYTLYFRIDARKVLGDKLTQVATVNSKINASTTSSLIQHLFCFCRIFQNLIRWDYCYRKCLTDGCTMQCMIFVTLVFANLCKFCSKLVKLMLFRR